ncbi:MAG TPA: energy transducer TonB [Terriglobales bacterium]|nr:energy transducer TonB [Terriglobales bacterium]
MNEAAGSRGSNLGASRHLNTLLAELREPWWQSLGRNLDDLLFPRKLPPLELTSRPVQVAWLEIDQPWWRSLAGGLRDLFIAEKQAPLELTSRPVAVKSLADIERPWWQSLGGNLRDLLFPERLPPLELTAKPVPVKEIWGDYNYRSRGVAGTVVVHVAMLALLGAISFVGARAVKQAQPHATVSLVSPDVSVYLPLSAKAHDTIGGGGGGGDRDKLQAPKGKLPRSAMEQFAPPAVVVRNENPKLPMEPTVVVPPEVPLPNVNLPNYGDPLSKVAGTLSNGTGSGGGIGAGSGGGIGSGDGPGFGPGSGGGTGGGVFTVGGGVSAPRPLYTPDPEYSEEARKAKHQGTVVLWLVVGPDGRAHDVRIKRSLGLGLDERAIAAVSQWKFEPARKNGVPVAVRINVEVDFKLY